VFPCRCYSCFSFYSSDSGMYASTFMTMEAQEMEEGRANSLAEHLSENSERILMGVLAVAVLAAIAVGGSYVLFFFGESVSNDPEQWGQLGDYLGGVLNPVFGFLSVFALLVALVLQTRELKLSREALKLSQEELKATREEQAKSAAALALQNEAIRKQSFEQTFFAMLRVLSERLEDATFSSSARAHIASSKGPAALRAVTGALAADVRVGLHREGGYSPYLSEVMGGVLSGMQVSGFAEYARTLSAILEYLEDAGVVGGDVYPKLLRSRMDKEEVLFLYFLCFVDGWQALKKRIEKYGLLAHIDPASTGAPTDYYSYFERSAFHAF